MRPVLCLVCYMQCLYYDGVLPSVYEHDCFPCPGPKAPASKRKIEDDSGGELTDLYCYVLRVLFHTSNPAGAESPPKKLRRSRRVKRVNDNQGV